NLSPPALAKAGAWDTHDAFAVFFIDRFAALVDLACLVPASARDKRSMNLASALGGNPEIFYDRALLLPAVTKVKPFLARFHRDEVAPLPGIERHRRMIALLGFQGRQGRQQLLGMCREMVTRGEHGFDRKA